jgi:hypothetical protein
LTQSLGTPHAWVERQPLTVVIIDWPLTVMRTPMTRIMTPQPMRTPWAMSKGMERLTSSAHQRE